MIYHVLPGDSLVETFEKTNLEGEIIVCRECLIEGDLKAKNLEDFWNVRENYLTKNFPQKENFYAENVRGEFEKLLAVSPGDEINLWFEYELFCQSNLWFCLSLLNGKDIEIFRVAPVVRNENNLWKGFGDLECERFEKMFRAQRQTFRRKMSSSEDGFGKHLQRKILKNAEMLILTKSKNFLI